MENLDSSPRRSLKHKLELKDSADSKVQRLHFDQTWPNFSTEVPRLVSLLNSTSDGAALKSAVVLVAKFVQYATLPDDLISTIVRCGAVPVLVSHLQAIKVDANTDTLAYQCEIETGCVIILGCVARKLEHQQLIIDAGALPCLVYLLRIRLITTISWPLIDLLRRVADAIFDFAFQNTIIKTLVRVEGGIPPLVELLEFNVIKVQRAAGHALRTLAFGNDDNTKQIVECNALPTLVLMLQSEDSTVQRLAICAIGNMIRSSPDILKDILLAGALQPVICLLRCQREAAFLIARFAASDSDCMVHISQRGAIPPLVDMLKSPYTLVQDVSAFALYRLAKDSHNKAGIAHNGGIEPLLNLLDSDYAGTQLLAAGALHELADNVDSVVDIIKAGGFQKLKDGHFRNQRTLDFVEETLKRLEKMQGQVLKHAIYLMGFAEKGVQRCVAIALAYLCYPYDCKTIFIDNNGLELLLDILESPNIKQKGDALAALHKLAAKAGSSDSILAGSSDSIFFAAPTSTTPWGTILDIAQDLPRASDQYVLDDLKRICENPIAQIISVENVSLMYKISEDFNATALKHACILFMLEKCDDLSLEPWYWSLVCRIVPDIRIFFSTLPRLTQLGWSE